MGDDENMGVSYGVEFGEGAEQMAMRPKAAVRYRECLKNHAAAIGGHAVDGCGDFMPAGEDGTLEALRCAACGCHRNFHRRELDGENPSSANNNNNCYRCVSSTSRSLGIAHPICAYPPLTASDSPEIRDPQGHYSSKKRFRTKFTQEQKDQMLAFAQRLGWRIQKQDEASVQRFCVETGVRRQVLKVWMHNNRKQHQSSSSSVVADRSPSFD